jgi:hypothetical protein
MEAKSHTLDEQLWKLSEKTQAEDLTLNNDGD